MRFLLPYAQLVRLPNTFTAMADIFVGALATGLWLQRWHVLLCLLGASTLLYWSGMIWNDYFDLDQDRKERPGRPIASGRVPLRTAWFLAVGLMAAGLALAVLAGFRIEDVEKGEWAFRSRPVIFASVLVIAILLYDGVLKATIAGPIMMGLCRSLNILLGMSIASDAIGFRGWLIALVVGIYIGGVTWFARTEARDSNRSMLIGAAIAMLVALVLSLAVPALVVEMPGDAAPSRLFPYLLAGFGCYLGVAVMAAIRRPEPGRVQAVIVRAIMGLVVLDALLASAFVGSVGLLLMVLLVPGLFLGRWIYST
jgi:4-hydroxybenzoate polyprenyltransferase